MRTSVLIRGVLAASLLVLAACTDLSAVRDFSRLSAGTADYRVLVDRYGAFGNRLAYYRERPVDVGDRAAQREGLLGLHTALTGYMDALGDLADDAVVSVSTAPLAEAAQKAALFDAAMRPPVEALGNVVARAVTARWRQRELGRVIEAGNAPVQDITARLVAFAQAQGDDDVQERLAIRTTYGRILENPRSDPAARRLLFERREERLAELDARAGARTAFIAAMRKIAEGHQALHDGRDRLSTDEVQRQIRAVNNDLRTIGRALQAAIF
jgi:hypothetical protein